MRMNSEICMRLKSRDSLTKLKRRNTKSKKEIIALSEVERREKQRLPV